MAERRSDEEQLSEHERKLVRLMRFVDGDVTPSEREVMLKEIESDPDAQHIVTQFRDLAAEMSAKFAGVAHGPVPQRLIDAIFETPAGVAAPAAPRSVQPRFNLRDRLGSWLTPPRLALVAASVVAVGIGIGVLTRGGPGTPATGALRIADGRAEADGLLKRALETAKSNVAVPARAGEGAAARVETRLTFKARSGGYCRQYLLDGSGGGYFGGIACREAGGKWVVLDHRPLERAKSVLASDPGAVFERPISKLISGAPLGDGEEDTVLARKWAD